MLFSPLIPRFRAFGGVLGVSTLDHPRSCMAAAENKEAAQAQNGHRGCVSWLKRAPWRDGRAGNFSSGTALSATVCWRVGFRPVVPGSRAELWILQATLPYFPRFPQNRAPRQGGGFCVFLALFLRKCLCFWEVGVPSAVANDCAGSGGNAVEGRWREGGVCAGRGCMCLLL